MLAAVLAVTATIVVVLLWLFYMTELPRAQHGDSGEGSLNVWHLIERVEKERRRLDEPTGRHALRDESHVDSSQHGSRPDFSSLLSPGLSWRA